MSLQFKLPLALPSLAWFYLSPNSLQKQISVKIINIPKVLTMFIHNSLKIWMLGTIVTVKDVKIRNLCTKLLLPTKKKKTELYRQLTEVSDLRIKKY